MGLLRGERPADGVLGEEGAGAAGASGLEWVVDPLDGTVNFLYGIPQWAVSVACRDAQDTLAAVVYDALHGETFAPRTEVVARSMDRRCGSPPRRP